MRLATSRPPGTPSRLRRRLGTLRWRLTLGLAAVLVLIGVVTAGATALLLRGYLVGRLDAQLDAASGRFATAITDHDVDNRAGVRTPAPGQAVGTLVVRRIDGRVTVAVVDAAGRYRILRPAGDDLDQLRALRPGDHPETIHLDRLGEYRVQAVAKPKGEVQVVGLPLQPTEDTVVYLVLAELTLFAVVVLASATGTAFFVDRELRPLRRLGDTARHVSDLPLTDSGAPFPDHIAPPEPTTEVDQVAVAFDHMLDQVRRALTERDHTEASLRRFVADASHELRTPLATIRAYREYTDRSHGDPEAVATAHARIDAATARMATLVDELLLLARLDAGRPLGREEVDMTHVVIDAVDDARTAAPRHGWRLDLPEEPVEVIGDGERLRQALVNLLTNAHVHTPPGTTVTARPRGGRRRPGTGRLRQRARHPGGDARRAVRPLRAW